MRHGSVRLDGDTVTWLPEEDGQGTRYKARLDAIEAYQEWTTK